MSRFFDEAFANYLTALTIGEIHGEKAFRDFLARLEERYAEIAKKHPEIGTLSYNVTEREVDIPSPPGSLASFTGTANGIEFGRLVYPNSTAVAKAQEYVVDLLRENGFQQDAGGKAFWERENVTYAVYGTYRDYYYVLFIARVRGGSVNERIERLSQFLWTIAVIGPSPGKVLGLFLPVEIVERTSTSRPTS